MSHSTSAELPTTALPDGRRIALMNSGETWLIYDEIFGERIYDRCDVQLHDGATVVDIGANIGLFLLFATDNHQGLKVYGYEPIPQTFEVLQHNRKLITDSSHKITLTNAGVWKEKTTAVFRHLPRFSCSSTMCPDDSSEQQQRALDFTLNAFDQHPNRFLATTLGILPGFARRFIAGFLIRYHAKNVEVECQLTTIADIFADNQLDTIDYLKLDAEGAEIEILESISDDHWSRIRRIVVETHRGDDSMESVESILQRNGFETQVSHSQSSPADQMVYGVHKSIATNLASSGNAVAQS